MLHKPSPYFQHLESFWQTYHGLTHENCKKTHKDTIFGVILGMQVPLKSCLNKTLLWSNKIKISNELLGRI